MLSGAPAGAASTASLALTYRQENNNMSRFPLVQHAGSSVGKNVATRPQHVRRTAMIWDDLVSLVRQEMINAEVATTSYSKPVLANEATFAPCADRDRHRAVKQPSQVDIDQTCSNAPKLPSHYSDNRIPSEVYVVSPLSIKRRPISFAYAHEFLSNNGDEAELSPRCISEMHNTIKFSAINPPPRLPWLMLDSEDNKDTDSLEYSDDGSNVEPVFLLPKLP